MEGAPCLGGHNRTGADGTAPAPTPTVKMVDPELGISSDAVRRKYARTSNPSALSCGTSCKETPEERLQNLSSFLVLGP